MSRQLKRQIGRGRRGASRNGSPSRPRVPRTPNQRLNRVLLIGGSLMALGAVVISLLAPHFSPVFLATNLGAIGLGLLMGKGFGRFLFRRILPTNK